MPTTIAERRFAPGSAGARSQVGVLVFAKDPVLRAGISNQLDLIDSVKIVRPAAGAVADVALVATDVLDGEALRVVAGIARSQRIRIIVVARSLDGTSTQRGEEAGASCLLLSSAATGARLAEAIGEARRDSPVGDTGPRRVPLHQHEAAPDRCTVQTRGLAARDIEVLRLLAEGYDTAEIASRLAYSEPTIKNVIQRLFERLEARNRPHAVATALRAGLI
jgi:DNA-binding NarL/FixJ family response regulator